MKRIATLICALMIACAANAQAATTTVTKLVPVIIPGADSPFTPANLNKAKDFFRNSHPKAVLGNWVVTVYGMYFDYTEPIRKSDSSRWYERTEKSSILFVLWDGTMVDNASSSASVPYATWCR